MYQLKKYRFCDFSDSAYELYDLNALAFAYKTGIPHKDKQYTSY